MQIQFGNAMKNVLEIIEKKPIQVIIGLLVFHAVMSCMLSWIAYSPYFADFHNGNGLWDFSRDSLDLLEDSWES